MPAADKGCEVTSTPTEEVIKELLLKSRLLSEFHVPNLTLLEV